MYVKDVGCEVIECFGMAENRFGDGPCEYSSTERSVISVSKSMDLGSIRNYMACNDFGIFQVQKQLGTQFSNCCLHWMTVVVWSTNLCWRVPREYICRAASQSSKQLALQYVARILTCFTFSRRRRSRREDNFKMDLKKAFYDMWIAFVKIFLSRAKIFQLASTFQFSQLKF
jgi:hypothetical protein